MSDEGEMLVSRADIARLTGVHRPAVANWERRHSDFPAPVDSVDGVDRFSAGDIAEWLGSRRIPRNGRLAGELEGASYADRFRRNLAARVGATAVEAGGPPGLLGDQLLDPANMDPLRGRVTIEQYRDLSLKLIYTAARHPDRWERLVRTSEQEDDAFLDALWSVVDASLVNSLNAFRPVVLASRETDAVRNMTRLIDQASRRADGVQQLRDAFSRALEVFAGRTARGSEELLTPPSITRLAGRLLAVTGGGDSLYDPYCRTGEFLAAAVAEQVGAGRRRPPPRVEGVAAAAEAGRLAEMHLAVHGVDANVVVGPALSSFGPRLGEFDLVVCNPPFNMPIDEETIRHQSWRYGKPSPRNANFAWLQYVLCALNEGGRAAVLMANNACFSASQREREMRAKMVEDGVVASIVALPTHLFAGTTVSATLWIFDKRRRHRSDVLFIDASQAGIKMARVSRVLSDDDLTNLVSIFARWWQADPAQLLPESGVRSVPVSEIRERDYSLHPPLYVEPLDEAPELRSEELPSLLAELRNLRNAVREVGDEATGASAVLEASRGRGLPTRHTLVGDVPASWQVVPLHQLVEIQVGPHLGRAAADPGGVPVVNPRDLRGGWILDDGLERVIPPRLRMVHRYGLMPGDILCVRTGELGRHGLVWPEQRGWLFGSGLLRLRPGDDILPEFLGHYLSLPQVRNWIRRQGSGTAVPNIQARTLGELPVVLPPIVVQQRIGRMLGIFQEEARLHDQLARTAIRLRETLASRLITDALSLP
ncbi:N-6 DNA methylase [Micromonospora sp. B11E3]|uniref:N-6 DNA methylase n=1 Tax=Micromonospora sp. B11E3 TaxID=3153562 RepID=UPI00325CB103